MIRTRTNSRVFDSPWSVLYREIAETAPATQRPYAIYLLGVNPPDEASDTELAAFNDFYTNVHLVEVSRASKRHSRHALRGSSKR